MWSLPPKYIPTLLSELSKTFLHKNHLGHQKDKFHLKISIKSNELKKHNKLESNKKIYKILDKEIKSSIHSIQILIN